VTRGWWILTFYRAGSALLWGSPPWPRSSAVALGAGWVFWAAALSAAVPLGRRWLQGKEEAGARTAGRLPAPPPPALAGTPGSPAVAPARPGRPPADGTLLGLAHGEVPVILTDAQATSMSGFSAPRGRARPTP